MFLGSGVFEGCIFPLYVTVSGRLWPCRDKMTVGRFVPSLFKTCLQKQINSLSSCLDWLSCIDNLLKCRKKGLFSLL